MIRFKLILFFSIFSNILFAQNNFDETTDWSFNNNYPFFFGTKKNLMVSGTQIKVREKGQLKSRVLDTLKVGTEVQIKEISKKTYKINGINLPFIKIQYSKPELKTGYVWLGYLTPEFVKMAKNVYFLKINKINPLTSKLTLGTYLLENEKKIIKLNEEQVYIDLGLEFSSGITISKAIIFFDYEVVVENSYSSCCSSFDKTTYLITSKNILELPRLNWDDQCGEEINLNYEYELNEEKEMKIYKIRTVYDKKEKSLDFTTSWKKIMEKKSKVKNIYELNDEK